MAESNFVFLYVPTASSSEALRIANTLVEERLVACANIIPTTRAVFFWEGKICRTRESILLAKTRSSLVRAAKLRIMELHSYSSPAILSFSGTIQSKKYAEWFRTVLPQRKAEKKV